MDVLLNTKEENTVISAIKHLSATCRILCDLHYIDSQAKIKLITPNLEKGLLTVIQDSYWDETLFGAKLLEKMKSSKTIETAYPIAGKLILGSEVSADDHNGVAARQATAGQAAGACPDTAVTQVRHAGRVQLFYNKLVSQQAIPLCSLSPGEKRVMLSALKKLLNLDASSECLPSPDQYILKYFGA